MDANLRDIANNARKSYANYLKNAVEKQDGEKFKIGVLGSITANPIIPYLWHHLDKINIQNIEVCLGPFNQIHQACFDHKKLIGEDLNVIIVLWRIEDLMPYAVHQYETDPSKAYADIVKNIDELVLAFKYIREHFDGELIVSNPPFPQNFIMDGRDLALSRSTNQMYRDLSSIISKGILTEKNIQLLDLDSIQRFLGGANVYNEKKWLLYRQPYNEEFWYSIAEFATRLIKTSKHPAKKCIVLDCDNTLWGGVIGEDGLSGIEIGEDFPGNAYQNFQKLVLMLYHRGVMLALASKNNETDVWEVFEKHSGMVLKREHISAAEINWQEKSQNIVSIAKKLNIGTDSLVFIDDNPFEIESMKQHRPEVECMLVPEEITEFPSLLRNSHFFDSAGNSTEDSSRNQMMAQENERMVAKKELSEEDFLKSLEMVIDVFRVKDEHALRVSQLINKTNQFNLTTRRRTQNEVNQLMDNKSFLVFGMSAKDKFGDYGIVGACIIEIIDSEAVVDTFLMSCRIMGRKVESAFLSAMIELSKKEGAKTIKGDYLKTEKNVPVKDFYANHDFSSADKITWSLEIEKAFKAPGYIELIIDD